MSDSVATILLVEDDQSLGQLLAEELEMDGYTMLRAGTVMRPGSSCGNNGQA